MPIYDPAEDSYLLQKHIRQHALGRVLDMGTGSGILALTAITNPNVHYVLAVDRDAKAVEALQAKIRQQKLRKIEAIQSDLFSSVQGKFNLILFNPPYLPQEKGKQKTGKRTEERTEERIDPEDAVEDAAIYGGNKGWETIQRFMAAASEHLFPDGKILLLFSSLTNGKRVEQILKSRLFNFHELDRQKLAFEELYVYLVEKSPLLKELETKGLHDIAYFAHGKRGTIYTAFIDRSMKVKSHLVKKQLLKVAVKVPRSAAMNIEKEAEFLQQVNAKGLGPNYLFHAAGNAGDAGDAGRAVGEGYLAYEFAEGEYITEWIMNDARKKEILSVLRELLHQCRVLDRMHISKQEMHHPRKHIIVNQYRQPVLLDFERCIRTDKPQNVTQFVEFIRRLRKELEQRGITVNSDFLRTASREYKQRYDEETFKTIIKALS